MIKGIYPNLRLLARSMKTKGVFWRYPRKISLLKDLRKAYPGVLLLCKSMKTGSELEIPSKISLLKDLAGDILEGDGSFSACGRRGISKLSKSRRSHCCYQTANVNFHYVSRMGVRASRGKSWRGE